jgi:DNA-binding response OmpR family regulator
MMPGLDGIELSRRIRASEAGRDPFLLLLTGRDTSEDMASALDAGVDDFVAKPVSPELLGARLVIAERRIQQNAARRSAEEALARARWLAGIGEATLTMQHEINNPLAALITEAQLLAEEPGMLEEHRRQIATIGDQARRIAEVVRRLAHLEDPRSVEYIEGMRMLELFPKKS